MLSPAASPAVLNSHPNLPSNRPPFRRGWKALGSCSWEITFGTDANALKVGFHGATPTAQAAHIPDPSGGSTVDAEARAAIEAILVVLEGKGLLAGS